MVIFENRTVILVGIIFLIVGMGVSIIGNLIVFGFVKQESVVLNQINEDINYLKNSLIDSEVINLVSDDGSIVAVTKSQMLVEIASSQIRSEKAIVLSELSKQGCQITNSFAIDANTIGISLVCPIVQNQ